MEQGGGAVGESIVGLVRAEDEDGEVGDGVACGDQVGDDEGEELVGEEKEGAWG